MVHGKDKKVVLYFHKFYRGFLRGHFFSISFSLSYPHGNAGMRSHSGKCYFEPSAKEKLTVGVTGSARMCQPISLSSGTIYIVNGH